MSKIILEGHVVVSDTDLASIMDELSGHIELTRRENGCLRFEVTQSTDAENVFYVYEEFIDRAAFEAHQQRVKLSDWGRVALSVERHYQVTEAD